MSAGPGLRYLLAETLLSEADRLPPPVWHEPGSCGVVSAEREAGRLSQQLEEGEWGQDAGLKAQRLQQVGGEDSLVLDCR